MYAGACDDASKKDQQVSMSCSFYVCSIHHREKYNEVGSELYRQQYPLEEKTVPANNIYEHGKLTVMYREMAFNVPCI